MYKIKRFSNITDDEYWEELLGRKLPPQYLSLRDKVEPGFKRIKELRENESAPLAARSLSEINDPIDVEELGSDTVQLLGSKTDFSVIAWNFKTNKFYASVGYKGIGSTVKIRGIDKSYSDIKTALIDVLDRSVEVRQNVLGEINSKVKSGQQYSRTGLMGFLFGKGTKFSDKAEEIQYQIDLIQEYRDYILRNLR